MVDEGKSRQRAKFNFALKEQYKIALRVTGLMLCCAVLFLCGFYLGIYQSALVKTPEQGIITGTYTPPVSENDPAASISGDNAGPSLDDSLDALAPQSGETTGYEDTAAPVIALSPTLEEILGSLKWPVDGKISKEPGWVNVGVTGSGASGTGEEWKYYSGVDITCDAGAPVSSALEGIVSDVKTDPMLGNVVIIRHGGEVTTTYGRVLDVQMEPGDRVAQGEAIGKTGSSGLYFSIAGPDEEEDLSARECLATAR